MTCKDKSITYLKSRGYNVVRVPKANINPLDIFVKERGILKPIGKLSSILSSSNSMGLPVINRDGVAADISGQETSNLSRGMGLSILGTIIGAMGGSKIGLEVGFKNVDTVLFSFANVLEDNIEIAHLDQYLGNADINSSSQYIKELLEADEVFVLTATIKSKEIKIIAKEKGFTNIDLNLPEIKEIVGGNIEVSKSDDNLHDLSFIGKIPLVFGFQAVKLLYEDGQYKTFKILEAGQGAASNFVEKPYLLTTENTFTNLLFND